MSDKDRHKRGSALHSLAGLVCCDLALPVVFRGLSVMQHIPFTLAFEWWLPCLPSWMVPRR